MLVWSGDAPLWLVSWLQHHDSSTNERPGGEQGAVADNHQLTSPEPAPPVSWRSHLEDCLVWQVIFYYLLSRYKSMILVFTSSITMFRWIKLSWNVIKSCVNLAEAEWGDLRGLFWVNTTSAAETHSLLADSLLQIIRFQLLSENVARTCFFYLWRQVAWTSEIIISKLKLCTCWKLLSEQNDLVYDKILHLNVDGF